MLGLDDLGGCLASVLGLQKALGEACGILLNPSKPFSLLCDCRMFLSVKLLRCSAKEMFS